MLKSIILTKYIIALVLDFRVVVLALIQILFRSEFIKIFSGKSSITNWEFKLFWVIRCTGLNEEMKNEKIVSDGYTLWALINVDLSGL